jgi:hypothetical protein
MLNAPDQYVSDLRMEPPRSDPRHEKEKRFSVLHEPCTMNATWGDTNWCNVLSIDVHGNVLSSNVPAT